jgi:2-polyprenyl-3-methyl-5-hydroxy-6-metoxy-1,4-benzoquinol methylase
MGLFRIQHNDFEKKFFMTDFDTEHSNEWESIDRINESAWNDRYDYEASLVCQVITENPNIKNVLELGSGPGILSQRIQNNKSDLNYHLVDKPFAKKYFDEHNFKGEFFVKDLSNGFDKSNLLNEYDLVIANDFLEHVYNPHSIIKTVNELTSRDSIFFISNPNWRMAHQYVYRGLFDFDNFVYLLYTHGFQLEGLYGSFLKTPNYPRLSSESLLPEENLYDWNHYMLFKHRDRSL